MVEILKEDNKLFSRLVSKDTTPNPSFRVYYGDIPIGVPFIWEAKPGTPKHPSTIPTNNNNNNLLPPLTPPPSYSYSGKKTILSSKKTPGKMIIFQGLFPKMMSIRHRRQISLASSSSTTTTLSEFSGSSSGSGTTRSRSLSSSLFDFAVNDDVDPDPEEDVVVRDSPRSMLCFGFGGGKNC